MYFRDDDRGACMAIRPRNSAYITHPGEFHAWNDRGAGARAAAKSARIHNVTRQLRPHLGRGPRQLDPDFFQ